MVTSDEDEEPEMEEYPADSSVAIGGLHETEYGGKSFKVAKVGKQVYIEGRAEVLQVVCDACLSLRPRSQLRRPLWARGRLAARQTFAST